MSASSALPALAFAVPLIVAAALAALSSVLHRGRIIDIAALLTACATLAMCLVLLLWSGHGLTVTWFGGWTPRTGPAQCHPIPCAIGVDFAVDPVGAAMASLAACLVVAALLFSWRYFEDAGPLFHVLMLAFLAAMVAFSFSGDLFDIFVFFELMGVAAFALTAYRVEDPGPVQGALNFAVTNSAGAYLILTGIGIVYARTGALNLLQIAATVHGHPDPAVTVAFLLVATGFLVKAAIVPFHFWIADAHASAPTPVCVLFSGVMVELGLYAIARVYWNGFAPAFGARSSVITAALLCLGVLTAVAGAVMCFAQHHVKRLLAFSTVSHAGMFLCGLALLSPLGLAGAGVYVLGHGLTKGALFIGAGILVHRFQAVDEPDLLGRGRGMVVTGALFLLGGLSLAGLPPFGTYMGKGLMEDAALARRMPWLVALFVLCSAVTAGAVLRVWARVFLGARGALVGDTSSRREGRETETGRGPTPATMAVPMAALLAAACGAGLLPALFKGAGQAAQRFMDTGAYARTVLGHAATLTALRLPLPSTDPTLFDVGTGAAAAAGAVLLAALAINRHRLPALVVAPGRRLAPPVQALRRLHSGDVRDYIAWLVLGAGALGVALLLRGAA